MRRACAPTLSKQYDSTNSLNPPGSNSDMGALEHGPESHGVKVLDTVN